MGIPIFPICFLLLFVIRLLIKELLTLSPILRLALRKAFLYLLLHKSQSSFKKQKRGQHAASRRMCLHRKLLQVFQFIRTIMFFDSQTVFTRKAALYNIE